VREIKFRAWDTKKGCWTDTSSLGIRLDGLAIGLDEGFLRHNPADVIMMQYTGLKDKNGKEVYEGDIIESLEEKRDSVRKGERGKVVYCDYGFCAESLPPDDWDVMSPSFSINVGPIKVIGNIYENPELLKEEGE